MHSGSCYTIGQLKEQKWKSIYGQNDNGGFKMWCILANKSLFHAIVINKTISNKTVRYPKYNKSLKIRTSLQ